MDAAGVTDDATTVRYVVMAELPGGPPYAVCIRRSDNPDWMQVVAQFSNLDRAEQYADIENIMRQDDPNDPRKDEALAIPSTRLPDSMLGHLLQSMQRGAPVQFERVRLSGTISGGNGRGEAMRIEAAPEPEEPLEEAQDADEPEDVLDEQPAANSREADEEEEDDDPPIERRSVTRVPGLLPAKTQKRKALSPQEQKVFDALCRNASNGIAQISTSRISSESGVPQGSMGAMLYGLELKGRIVFLERGGPQAASKYRVLMEEAIA